MRVANSPQGAGRDDVARAAAATAGRKISSFAGSDWQEKFADALDSGEKHLVIDGGTNDLDGLHWAAPTEGLLIEGPGRDVCKMRTSYQSILRLSGVGVKIRGISFESTKVNSSTTYYGGLIHVYDGDNAAAAAAVSLDSLLISECRFKAAGLKTGAIGFYDTRNANANTIKNLCIIYNDFVDIGSAAIVLQNHYYTDGLYRISDFLIAYNKFTNLGIVDDYGMAITSTGHVANGIFGWNKVYNPLDIALEIASGNRNVKFLYNGVGSVTRRSVGGGQTAVAVVSRGNASSNENWDCEIIGTHSLDLSETTYAAGGMIFANMRNGKVANNTVRLDGGFTFRDVQGTDILDNDVKSITAAPWYFQQTTTGTCTPGVVRGNKVSAIDRGSAVTAMVTLDRCTDVVIQGGRLDVPSVGGGPLSRVLNSATRNYFTGVGLSGIFVDSMQTIAMSDANYTQLPHENNGSKTIRLTGTLTATRTLYYASGQLATRLHWNNTTGGQSVSIGPSGGTGVTLANGARQDINIRSTDASALPAIT